MEDWEKEKKDKGDKVEAVWYIHIYPWRPYFIKMLLTYKVQ